jgi:hypothetical protein
MECEIEKKYIIPYGIKIYKLNQTHKHYWCWFWKNKYYWKWLLFHIREIKFWGFRFYRKKPYSFHHVGHTKIYYGCHKVYFQR